MVTAQPINRRALVALALAAISTTAAPAARAADVPPLTQFEPDTKAVAAEVNANFETLREAVNAKQDEATAAGIDFSDATTAATLSSTTRVSMRTVTVTVPGPGVLAISFSAQGFLNHVFTGEFGANDIDCLLEIDGAALDLSRRIWSVPLTEPTGGRNQPISIDVALEQLAPGSVTIAATCIKTGQSTAQISRPSLIATFFEQRY